MSPPFPVLTSVTICSFRPNPVRSQHTQAWDKRQRRGRTMNRPVSAQGRGGRDRGQSNLHKQPWFIFTASSRAGKPTTDIRQAQPSLRSLFILSLNAFPPPTVWSKLTHDSFTYLQTSVMIQYEYAMHNGQTVLVNIPLLSVYCFLHRGTFCLLVFPIQCINTFIGIIVTIL